MNNVTLIIGVTAVIILILILLSLLSRRPRPRCPECGSQQIGVEKTVTGMDTFDYHSGGDGGGYTSIHLQYIVKYHCNVCGAKWIATEKELQ